MSDARLEIRLHSRDKKELEEFAKSLDLTPSRVVRVLIKQAITQRRLLLFSKDPKASLARYLAKAKPAEDVD